MAFFRMSKSFVENRPASGRMPLRTQQIEQALAIVVPSVWTNDQKGSFLEKLAAELLRRQSYAVTSRVRFTGMEIDLLADHKPSGEHLYVECKFLSSAVSANVIDQMLGQALRRGLSAVALFSAGHLSKEAKGAIAELRAVQSIKFSHYGPDVILEAMVDAGLAPDLTSLVLPSNLTHATLLVHPEHPHVWLMQEQKDGRPTRVIPLAVSKSDPPTPIALRELLDQHEMLEGLQIGPYFGTSPAQLDQAERYIPERSEVVGRVTTAETILDYRPCAPEDFIGRSSLQKEIWDQLDGVRNGSTETRLIAVTGASGYGKSSLVAKLASRFRNKKWKNKYFLFPVDVRSAHGPLFVAEAVLQALRTAADSGFIVLPTELGVSDADNVLESESIREVLEALAAENKVLVVFFDQFEEVFTKDELLPIFRVFRRFALDVHAKQSRLVVGFSWRTGISLSNDNPAYQLWNELRDHRVTKLIGPFDAAESSGLVSQFERELDDTLLPPLRRRLQEQGQGVPWFLKKLCIHVHSQLQRGASQLDLLGSRLNVQALFDEDLDPLTQSQLSCLRFIAMNSPVDSLEAYERYGNDVVSGLIDKRLVVRAGQRFAVYWDIFRDYLTDGKVPSIPWTYIPNCTLGMALTGVEVMMRHGAMTTYELAQELSYSEATTVNIVTDLQNLALCAKDATGRHVVLDGINLDSIPERIRSQFVEHTLYMRLLERGGEGGSLTRSEVLDIVRSLYSGADVKPRTRDNYLPRLLPWLEYAGLVDVDSINIRLVAAGTAGRRDRPTPKRARANRSGTFLACAAPEVAEGLLATLLSGSVDRAWVDSRKLRNPRMDLCSLNLARWTDQGLVATKRALLPGDARRALRDAVSEAKTYELFSGLVNQGNSSRAEVGRLLGEKLGKNWKSTSAVRYANGLSRYLEYMQSP